MKSLIGVVRFEWRRQTHQLVFGLAAVVFALLAVMLVGTGYGPDGVDVNAPTVVMQSLGLLSLLAVFLVMIFVAGAGLRDGESGMAELVYATPIGKAPYLFGRWVGAMAPALAIMTLAAAVLMLAPFGVAVEPERLGPLRPLAYGWALAVLVIPNLVLVGAILYAVAVETRSSLATYVAGIAIYALYFVAALLIDSPLMAGTTPPTAEALARAALLDPFGLSAFFEQTRHWTPAERDVRFVALEGRFLWNRLLVLAMGSATLVFTYHRFEFRTSTRGRKLVPRVATGGPQPDTRYQPLAPPAESLHGWWTVLRSALRLELRHVLRGWTFLALLLLWAFVAGMEAVAQLGGGEYGTRVLPTTGLIVGAMQLPLLLLGTVTIVYYAAEVAWRERVVGVDALVDVTPASNAVFYLAKAIALAALPLLMALVAVAVGMMVQLAQGWTQLEPALYLSLLWFGGFPLILFALGALAIQGVSPNRWVGLLGGLALALLARRGDAIGLEHPMLRYTAAPSTGYSDMGGFGPVAESFAAFMVYWAAVGALLVCVGWGLWRRGLDKGLLSRVARLPRNWGRAGTVATTACGLLSLAAGGALLTATARSQPWEGRAARAAWQADYERAYRRIAGRAQPSVIDVETTIDLYPSERRAAIAGVYRLENRTGQAIDTVWAVTRRDLAQARVTMSGADEAAFDPRFGVHVLPLARPLEPGATAELRFAVSLDRSGLRAGDFDYDVVANGSFLTSLDAFPTLGYRASYELGDLTSRRRNGLSGGPSALAPLPTSDSARAALARSTLARSWLTLDATISTSHDQTALGPGRLVAAWDSAGRRYFRYRLERPVTERFGFVSANYHVRRAREGDVEVEVWFHPAHEGNVAAMLTAATRTLDLMGRRFGPYPHPVLRIVEVPAWSPFGALALPGIIFFTEDRGFLSDPRAEDVDLITRRTAHEVAHQWWGHTLDPADVAGATMLVETLAKYSEQLVVADLHGPAALPVLLAYDEDRYLSGRAADPAEPALQEVTGQPYLYYGKGAVVMNALRDLLGTPSVDRALARTLAAHGGPQGGATTLDLLAELEREAKTAHDRALVRSWFGDRVVYSLQVDSATVAAREGRFRVEGWISASSTIRRGATEEPRGVDGELIEVALFAGDPRSGRVLYAGKHPVINGRIALAAELRERPMYIVVDPFVTRIDRDRSDNRRRLAAGP